MEKLKQLLKRIDGKGYKAYKDIVGSYAMHGMNLYIDYVQGDPFASPSRIRVIVSRAWRSIEQSWIETPWRQVATCDYIARQVARSVRQVVDRSGRKAHGHGKSGLIAIDAPGQEVLPRTAVEVDEQRIELRLSIGLPASGRTILGKQAAYMLCEQVPRIVRDALVDRFELEKLYTHLELADQQQAIRAYMQEHELVAFVGNGSILPRESGVSDRPMRGEQVVAFKSPPTLEVSIPVPHREPICGMALRAGVTLIVGGGYHGKSTLLKALERGVYNHIPGDGREYVLTDVSAVKIRAEDGRSVEKVCITPFISNLPFDKQTDRFSTDDASGSTSQAASIMEAMEGGSRVLLIDEDTSATNFMIRDARMQRLVAKEHEPITPFVDRVRALYEQHKVSTIVVLGGSGDYFNVADTVVRLDAYQPSDVTKQAHAIANELDVGRQAEGEERFPQPTSRVVLPRSFDASRGKREKCDAKGLYTILLGKHEIDLSSVEQLVDPSQTRAIARMLMLLGQQYADGKRCLCAMIDQLYKDIEAKGLDHLSPYHGKHPGDFALPRKLELAAAVNRMRTLQIK